MRANNSAKPRLAWRLNETGDWNEVDFSEATDRVNIAGDGKIDMRFLAWIKAGKARLEAGGATVEFRMHSGVQNHGGLDCFVFSQGGFAPSGKLKPGAKLGLADAGSWAFEPGRDPLSAAARIDLSKLNEDRAGMNGFVTQDGKGDFVDGHGESLRFWAVAVPWRASLGLPNPDGKNLTGMLFWDERLQAAYKGWWRKLLMEKNPHTGVPLAGDPAVAILQLQNEDSLLFFTLQSVKGEARRDLRRKFHGFLKRKHGSVQKAVAS